MKKFFMCLIIVFLASSKIATAQQVVNNVKEGFTPAYWDADPFMVNAIYHGSAVGEFNDRYCGWKGYFSKTGFPTLVEGQTYGIMFSRSDAFDFNDYGLRFEYECFYVNDSTYHTLEYDGCGLFDIDTDNPYFYCSDSSNLLDATGVNFIIYTEGNP